jgi:site-specific DNA-methyltransferase (adenine-specific)
MDEPKIGSKLMNIDCMEYMRTVPDKAFELAICDPPYGIKDKIISGGETNNKIKLQKNLEKFDVVPSREYITELFRVSINQIIWGGNYFVDFLTHSRGWIVWDKGIPDGMNFAKVELAYTSFNVNANIVKPIKEIKTIHACQKPIALYKWLLKNYAKAGDKIFDSHLGSGSIAIACYDMGYDLTGCELDKDYYDAAVNRLNKHKEQVRFFNE